MTDDQIELRPANENPWYLLATYYGEQTSDEFDEDLHAKNREVWNRWVAAALSDEDRQKLIDAGRATEAEMTPLSAEERQELWADCRSPNLPAPDPATDIDLSDTVFSTTVSFAHFIFPAPTLFTRSAFQGNAVFEHAEFKGIAVFMYAAFKMDADFQHAVFKGIAIFMYAAFKEYAYFQHATFQGIAYFNGSATREDTAKFRKFSGLVNFDNVTFSGSADFTNREFLDKTNFNNAKFLTRAPVFADTTLHEGTTWHDVQWPGTPDDPEEARDMADAYSHLRRRSNAIQDHEAELDFYGRELRAKRAAVDGATGLLISLYEWSCGFGASVGLPLVWLFGLWASGPPFCRALLRLEGAAEIDGITLYGFSLASVGGFFGMRKEFFAEFMKDLPGTVLALSGAQSLLGAVFVFLLGLSLRNRFRIK